MLDKYEHANFVLEQNSVTQVVEDEKDDNSLEHQRGTYFDTKQTCQTKADEVWVW